MEEYMYEEARYLLREKGMKLSSRVRNKAYRKAVDHLLDALVGLDGQGGFHIKMGDREEYSGEKYVEISPPEQMMPNGERAPTTCIFNRTGGEFLLQCLSNRTLDEGTVINHAIVNLQYNFMTKQFESKQKVELSTYPKPGDPKEPHRSAVAELIEKALMLLDPKDKNSG